MKKYFFILLFLFSKSVFALGTYSCTAIHPNPPQPTYQEACFLNQSNPIYTVRWYQHAFTYADGTQKINCWYRNGVDGNMIISSTTLCGLSCPANSTKTAIPDGLSAGINTCVCNAGFVDNGSGQCVVQENCSSKAGTSAGIVTLPDGYAKSGNANSNDFLNPPTNRKGAKWGVGGCEVVVTDFPGPCYRNKNASTNGYYAITCDWKAEYTGNQSNAGPPQQSPPPSAQNDQKCPSGTTNIGTDSSGGPICTGNNPNVPKDPAKNENKVTNPDGSTTTTSSTTTKNKDGSTTTRTTTTTTSADGKSTSSSTTSSTSNVPGSGTGSGTGTDPRLGTGSGTGAGTPGKDDSSEESSDEFCKQNPDLNICKNSNVSGGSCSGGADDTSCEGDAIQCSILREQRKRHCEDEKMREDTQAKDYTQLGNQILAGEDPRKNDYPTVDKAQVVNAPQLDTSGSGGSCFSDKSFVVSGRSVTIPFSSVCPHLEALRYVVMVIAALASLKIVGGAIFS